MADSIDSLAAALGRMPSGIFVLTTGLNGRSSGMLASWVQQAGFEPPMITVAVRRDRYIAEWIAESGSFTLNQVGAGNKPLLKHFGRGFGPDEPAFTGVAIREDRPDGPILADAIAYLHAVVKGSIDSGDHRIFLAEVTQGARLDPDADPMVHIRKSGLHY
ncbi:MAG: flavin reductase family protein [Planctomycetota bacterium]|nr:flavin reductase family protein [Planctomycetota bacterium]